MIFLWIMLALVGSSQPEEVAHSYHGTNHQHAERVEEIPLGVSVNRLKGKINQLRRPVEALLHRLEEVSENSQAKSKQIRLPRNYHLVWHETAPRNDRIFVSFTSFDGLDCQGKIRSLYKAAKNPQLVFVGITEVHTPGTPTCEDPDYKLCNTSEFCPTDNIRRRVIPRSGYKGPSHSQYVNSLMFHGEQYILSLSSEQQRFVVSWDEILTKEYEFAHQAAVAAGQTGKIALSGNILSGPETGFNFSNTRPLRNCKASLSRGEVIDVPSTEKNHQSFEWASLSVSSGKDGTYPGVGQDAERTPFASYKFIFGQRELLSDVPADPHTPYLTADEHDMLLSVKLFTHGYAIYLPRRSPFWSIKASLNAPRPELEEAHKTSRLNSLIRAGFTTGQVRESEIKKIPEGHPSITQRAQYEGVGKLRSAGQFFAFAGLDIHRFVVKDVCHV